MPRIEGEPQPHKEGKKIVDFLQAMENTEKREQRELQDPAITEKSDAALNRSYEIALKKRKLEQTRRMLWHHDHPQKKWDIPITD
jgi:hypothetical protein